ncbi:PE-PPE domain-containing protein [Mycobacterium paraterrae]|uniref:PE-PPE domain-containing protein n=1 Tax=Mycobacterium paraterrae TaxID=577492 RepID=A0ABY3VGG7_9MYCO|nr:PE-PPE domain-containing protein [Mycobacterium paraterrae]UMB67551.1 PE-PPE domain-containing protein [Mycobacterium paraterrae]
MTNRVARGKWVGMLATAGVGLLPLAPLAAPAVAHGDDTLPYLVMGGSGMPLPDDAWVNTIESLFLPSNADATALYTPEQFYPLGLDDLTLDDSVSQGLSDLDTALKPYIDSGAQVGVFGYSQSAIIASLEMSKLEAEGVPSSNVSFTLIGDLMNPNGGIFERFAGLDLTSLGIDFSGATPFDDYPTTIYTMEYDYWADFPKYPLNLLSDLNAFMGQTHFDYDTLTAEQVASAIPLETTGGLTDYYIIPVDDLPLLDPVRDIPIIGNPIADLLQPDLTALVNLGYGDPEYGWSTTPANEATEFGLFPSIEDLEKLPNLLITGTQQGIQDFIGDFTGTGPNPVSLSLDSLLSGLTDSTSSTSTTALDPDAVVSALTTLLNDPAALAAVPGDLTDAFTEITNTLSGSLAATEDILYAALVSVPEYNLSLVLDNLDNPIEALGLPIAADLAIYELLGGFQSTVLENAASSIAASLTELLPAL